MYDCKVNFNTESEIKDQATAIYSELGLDMTTALNLFLRKTIQCNGIPFDLVLDEKPSKRTLEAAQEINEIKNHKEEHEFFDGVDSFWEDVTK